MESAANTNGAAPGDSADGADVVDPGFGEASVGVLPAADDVVGAAGEFFGGVGVAGVAVDVEAGGVFAVEPLPGLEDAVAVVAGRVISAVRVPAFGSRWNVTGVRVRQAGTAGVVSAQAGNATRVSREAQSPPNASANCEYPNVTCTAPGVAAMSVRCNDSNTPVTPTAVAAAFGSTPACTDDGVPPAAPGVEAPGGVAGLIHTGNDPAWAAVAPSWTSAPPLGQATGPARHAGIGFGA